MLHNTVHWHGTISKVGVQATYDTYLQMNFMLTYLEYFCIFFSQLFILMQKDMSCAATAYSCIFLACFLHIPANLHIFAYLHMCIFKHMHILKMHICAYLVCILVHILHIYALGFLHKCVYLCFAYISIFNIIMHI